MKAATGVLSVLILLGSFVVSVNVANAQPSRAAPPGKTRQILLDFDARLKRIDEFLVDGESKKAYSQATSLIEDMTGALIGGPGVGEFLGVATVLRALAAYQLGDEAEALWHWHVATQLFPAVSDYKMTAYGPAGDFLKSRPLGSFKAEPAPKSPGPFKPPKKRRGPRPTIPRARRGSDAVSVLVSAIIGKNGRPFEPRILRSEGELTLVCATLDKLRLWEFQPATKGGIPMAVPMLLKVDFKP